MAPLLEIDEVMDVPAASEHLAGYSVELPGPGSGHDTWSIPISGWALGRNEKVVSVAAVHQQVPIRSAPVSLARADVAEAFPEVPGRDQTGFRMHAGAAWLPEKFALRLEAKFENGHHVPFALIRGRRAPLPAAQTDLNPITVTALGRSGATLAMAMLAEHPEVVVYGGHPFASRPAAYWSHLMRVLSDPADVISSAHPDTFHQQPAWVGAHPFNDASTTDVPELADWFGHEYPASLAEFARHSSQQLYRRLGGSQGISAPRFFAEKHEPGSLARLTAELYTGSREILVVRDFRDMACSMLACFRTGRVSFGREHVNSDVDFVFSLAPAVARLVAYAQERRERVLVIRYEDLVLDPQPTLRRILDHLGLEANRGRMAGIITSATSDSDALRAHRTAADLASSVGRYRSDMDDELLGAAEDCFAPALDLYGYSPAARLNEAGAEELLAR